jgi:hypothetical protein
MDSISFFRFDSSGSRKTVRVAQLLQHKVQVAHVGRKAVKAPEKKADKGGIHLQLDAKSGTDPIDDEFEKY